VTLRQKLLGPLLLITLVIGAYVYGFWIPRSLAIAEANHLRMVDRHLESMVEGLIPLMLSNQLETIHENLGALRASNRDWVEVRLTDGRGRQLFPVVGSMPLEPQRGELRTLEKEIRVGSRAIGHLLIRIDIAPTLGYVRRSHLELTLLWLGMVVAVTLTMVVTLEMAVRRPARRLAEAAGGLAQQDYTRPLPPAGDDEVGALVSGFSRMRDELRAQHAALNTEIKERREAEAQLQLLNRTLEQRVQEEVAKNRDKDHVIIQQSRLAAMGEMVHNIAHQWRQPLNSLALLLSNMRDDVRLGGATPESIDRDMGRARRLIEKMSTTIDEFRDFFRPDREAVDFDLARATWEALSLVDAALRYNRIMASSDLTENLTATGFPSQFSQAVLNLLVNAKEAIVARRKEAGEIYVRLVAQGDHAVLTVEDNGGGIPAEVLPRIFEPYFTTKEQGSGIGLYMVKMIIEKNMGGEVQAENTPQGARLTVRIPITKRG